MCSHLLGNNLLVVFISNSVHSIQVNGFHWFIIKRTVLKLHHHFHDIILCLLLSVFINQATNHRKQNPTTSPLEIHIESDYG